MGVQLLLIADTHVPRQARTLPDEVWRLIDSVDVVVHAGDWVDPSLVNEVEARARRLVGVHGNNDGPAIRARLPEVARVELGGLRFGVVHETGPATGRERRCDDRHPGLDVLVFGHSHIPVGHHNAARDAAAQPQLAHRQAPAAAPHLPDRGRARGGADGRQAAPAGPPGTWVGAHVTTCAAVSSEV
jgi:putative phosphoesterase